MLESMGQPAYRGRQLQQWIYKEFVFDFQQMSNLPLSLRQGLAGSATVLPVVPVADLKSADGTKKVLLQLADGHTIEAVLMSYDPTSGGTGRRTVCVSTQAGCAIGCAFCATGKGGFVRHLSAGEIVGQVLYFEAQGEPVTNVVFMGQGEPLLNFDAVRKAMETLNAPATVGIAARHLTISTAGIIPGIKRLAALKLQVGLAVSLHAPTDAIRDSLVPVNKRYPIKDLLAACWEYVESTGRRVTFEYILIRGVNDSAHHAKELGALLRGHLAHVNLIPMNPVEGLAFQPPSRDRVAAFQAELNRNGVPHTMRQERGRDILAACGQLQVDRSVRVR